MKQSVYFVTVMCNKCWIQRNFDHAWVLHFTWYSINLFLSPLSYNYRWHRPWSDI